MITEPNKGKSILNEPYILVTDRKIDQMAEIQPILELILKQKKPLLIVAADINPNTLNEFIESIYFKEHLCVIVKTPAFGDRRIEMCKDIAIVTGGKALLYLDKRLEDLLISDLRQADKVMVDSDTTTIVGGLGNKIAIVERLENLKKQINETYDSFDREKLNERYKNLCNGVAIIKIGGKNAQEIHSNKEYCEKLLNPKREKAKLDIKTKKKPKCLLE